MADPVVWKTIVYHQGNPIGPTVHWVWMDWDFVQANGYYFSGARVLMAALDGMGWLDWAVEQGYPE